MQNAELRCLEFWEPMLKKFSLKTPLGALLCLVAVLFVLNIFAWKEVFAIAGPHYLKVSVLDVGQGDSIFIQTPDRRTVLVDGGPDAQVMTRLGNLLAPWENHLDVVVLTHPDADHLNGLLYVLKKYKVDYIVWTGIARDGAQYQQWIELLNKAKEQGSKIVIANLGDQMQNGDVKINILNPFENVAGQYLKATTNETGIVLSVVHGQNSFLLTADTGFKTEDQLLANKIDVDFDVLKIGHHGSKHSTSENFLQAVSPQMAVISVGGKNTYGHPTPEVLQRLEKFGIKTFRTDLNGTVSILSDGNNIQVK